MLRVTSAGALANSPSNATYANESSPENPSSGAYEADAPSTTTVPFAGARLTSNVSSSPLGSSPTSGTSMAVFFGPESGPMSVTTGVWSRITMLIAITSSSEAAGSASSSSARMAKLSSPDASAAGVYTTLKPSAPASTAPSAAPCTTSIVNDALSGSSITSGIVSGSPGMADSSAVGSRLSTGGSFTGRTVTTTETGSP